MPSSGRSPVTAAMIMTEDAKTEENTAGWPCGAYIGTPCKFTACRALKFAVVAMGMFLCCLSDKKL